MVLWLMYKVLKLCFKIYHYIQVVILRVIARFFSNDIDLSQFNKVLIISPHPDDEVFGCGALINSLIRMNKQVDLIILSKGEDVHRHCCPGEEDDVVQTRVRLAAAANNVLGMSSTNICCLDFPDGDFASVKERSDLIAVLKKHIEEIDPIEVFIPHPYENSPDHVAATEIVEEVLRETSISIYYYCVWVWYHMPIFKILKLKYRNACLLRVNRKIKNSALNMYIDNSAKCGVSYSGDLPKPFIYAFRWGYELFFKRK